MRRPLGSCSQTTIFQRGRGSSLGSVMPPARSSCSKPRTARRRLARTAAPSGGRAPRSRDASPGRHRSRHGTPPAATTDAPRRLRSKPRSASRVRAGTGATTVQRAETGPGPRLGPDSGRMVPPNSRNGRRGREARSQLHRLWLRDLAVHATRALSDVPGRERLDSLGIAAASSDVEPRVARPDHEAVDAVCRSRISPIRGTPRLPITPIEAPYGDGRAGSPERVG